MSMRKPNDDYYYLNSVRNQILVFMSLFTNMKVVDADAERDDFNTTPTTNQTSIDIVYTPRERKAIEEDYRSTRPLSDFDMKVPRFSVNIANITYDSSRALNFYRQRRIKANARQYNDRMPIPYNIGMNIDILAKYEIHLHQIIENIAPFFSPYILVRIKENVDFLPSVPRELKIDFNGDVLREVSVEWQDEERRIVKSQLGFNIRGWIYKPISETPGPILNIPISLWNDPIDRDEFDNLLCRFEVSGPNWMPPTTTTI